MAFIDEICGGDEELLSVEVPEWSRGDETCIVYFTPFTLADLKKIRKHAKGSDDEAIAYTVIFKAMNKNGDPLFTLEDKAKLMRKLSSDVLANLVREMNEKSSGN